MKPIYKKLIGVAVTLVAMAWKQYDVHGRVDVVELAQWVTANWDVLGLGGVVGALFWKRSEERELEKRVAASS